MNPVDVVVVLTPVCWTLWVVLSDGVADRDLRCDLTVSANDTPLTEVVEIDFRRPRPRRVSVSPSLSDDGVYSDMEEPNPARCMIPPIDEDVDAVDEALERVLVIEWDADPFDGRSSVAHPASTLTSRTVLALAEGG